MDLALSAALEQLVAEFGHLRCGIVVGALTACVDEFPTGDPYFIEQAARARLALLGEVAGAPPLAGTAPGDGRGVRPCV